MVVILPLDYFNQISIFGPSSVALIVIVAANVLFTGIHIWQEWKGERWPLWRVFGAVVGVWVPNAAGFLFFTFGLSLLQWAVGLMAYTGWLPFVGTIPTGLAIGSLGAVLGARTVDSAVSHWGLHLLGYRPNPGLSSTVLYAIEAIVILAAFRQGLILDTSAAWTGFAGGALLFLLVLPFLALLRVFLKPCQREKWVRWQPIPAWASS